MPVDRGKYPDNWEDISLLVKLCAGWRCQKCGAEHMEDGTMGTCLTVHHPDRDPGDPLARMEALCARCHLAAHRREKRNRKQLDLLGRRPGC